MWPLNHISPYIPHIFPYIFAVSAHPSAAAAAAAAAGVAGVVTMPFSVREGINIFLAGFVPTENLRFRDEELTFKVSERADESAVGSGDRSILSYTYPAMTKTLLPRETPPAAGAGESKAPAAGEGGDAAAAALPVAQPFRLRIEPGRFTNSEIIVLLGENGTGKTTFIRMLAGLQKSDEQVAAEEAGDEYRARQLGVPVLNVSYKPQKISPKFEGTVRELLHSKVRDAYLHPQFVSDVTRPLRIDSLIDLSVKNLSGGEIQVPARPRTVLAHPRTVLCRAPRAAIL